MYITCTLDICKNSGKHFYYKGAKKIYDMPEVIPEMYRAYANLRGRIYEIYARLVTDDESTSITNFVDKFPDWSDIKDCNESNESWTEEDHDKFHAALSWFSAQETCYTISWTDD
jgi:hypothetical protein